MEAMREAWTDNRLDDLNRRVDGGFADTKREFQAVRLEIRTEFTAVRSEMKEMRSEMREMRGEMGATNRVLLQVGVGALATFVVGFGGTIAAVLTQV